MPELCGDIDCYRIEDRVARGRSGHVFFGRSSTGAPVALKVHERPDDGWREVERLRRFEHASIIELLDSGQSPDGWVWLALPWVEGRTLAHLLADEAPLPLDRARWLIDQLADAVDELHRGGLVHGDLSPNNMLVDDDDRLRVIDLGASTGGDGAAVDATTGIEVATTPRYAAPEVAEGRTAGPAADRYAVGLVAYEAVTGSSPFPEVATPIAMLAHHASTEPVAPTEHRPDLPAAVDATLLWALAKDPEARPATAMQFADAFAADDLADAVALGAPPPLAVGAGPPVEPGFLDGGVDVAALDGDAEPDPEAASGRTRFAVLGAALAAATLFAVVGIVLLGSGGGGDGGDETAATEADGATGEAADQTDEAGGVDDGDSPGEDAGGDAEDDAAPTPLDQLTPAAAVWPAGRAAGYSCNMLQAPGFEVAPLPNDFYGGDDDNTVAAVAGIGAGGSNALRVGGDDSYGFFAEIVTMGSHSEFVLSAWLGTEGEPFFTAVYVDYLDADFVLLTAVRDNLPDDNQAVPPADGGLATRVELRSAAPEGAVYAVPTFFKDGSDGALLVDEVVFGPAGTCPDLAS
ncbi:MAG: serine/threonine-protein kinase [Actinomycetota bacterium]